MKSFVNKTNSGNELAIKRGPNVPEDAVNISWIKNEPLAPSNSVVVLDTSRTVPENINDTRSVQKIMYANGLGVLVDEYDNEIVDEEFPIVGDVFSVDEDFSVFPGSEYTANDILPFVHVSRYFHADFPGLTLGTTLQSYSSPHIKVVDNHGNDYVNSEGAPKYRITITPVYNNVDPRTPQNSSNAAGVYRVWAFVDTDTNEDLYLTYNKVELSVNGYIEKQHLTYKEILNPQPYYQYRPEESDVVDPVNRKKKIYSTKPASAKSSALGISANRADGYRIYVPKKAIPDPRTFQMFRWRVNCEFVQSYKVDPIKSSESVRCGVVVNRSAEAGNVVSSTPYAFYNLWKSKFNLSKINFINPTRPSHNEDDRKNASYWEVDFAALTNEQLKQYDVLLWTPTGVTMNFKRHLVKIKYFTETLGKTLIIDTQNLANLEDIGVVNSGPVAPLNGNQTVFNVTTGSALAPSVTLSSSSTVIQGGTSLGGWNISVGDDSKSIALFTYPGADTSPGHTHYINSFPTDFTNILSAPVSGSPSTFKSLLIGKTDSIKGNLFITTAGTFAMCAKLFSSETGKLLNDNTGSKIANIANYFSHINSFKVSGAMKLFYNCTLQGVKSASIDNDDEKTFSSTWKHASKWQTSWAINGDVLDDQEKAEFNFTYLPKDALDQTQVWQRKLSNKTLKQLIDEDMGSADIKRVAGSKRKYSIEVTNSLVSTPVTLVDTSVPYAWTTAYSAKFEVPVELGPFIVKQDLISGEYESGQFGQRIYPAKPYAVKVNANYNNSEELMTNEKVNWTAQGTATRTINIPPQTTTSTTDAKLSWSQYGNGVLGYSSNYNDFNVPIPQGLATWQGENYLTSDWGPGHLNWPHFGFEDRLTVGSSGETVHFVQYILNQFYIRQYFDTGSGNLSEDGAYGQKTATAVRNFQNTFQARYLDGVVDAETYGLIARQTIRMQTSNPVAYDGGISKYISWIMANCQYKNFSDGDFNTGYRKRSWVENGPSVIWEIFGICLPQSYNIHAVSLIPYLSGATQTIMFRSIHVTTIGGPAEMRGAMINYNSDWSQAGYMPHRPNNGEEFRVAVGPYQGNCVFVGIGQDGGSGYGTSRQLGIRDIFLHAKVNSTTTTNGTVKQDTVNITATGSASVSTNVDVIQQANVSYNGQGTLSNIVWNSISDNNANVASTITPAGKVTLRNNNVNIKVTSNFTFGTQLPGTGNTYHSMTVNKILNPIPETGWASKSEGIKLLCGANKMPVGFPTLPTAVADGTPQRHYTTLSVESNGTDPLVIVGFYDINQQEFVTNSSGVGEMSYIEYQNRGPQNIYIAVLSTHEVTTQEEIPKTDDGPPLPFKWAMPVYGVYSRNSSRIGIEPLPSNLGITDVWPVPIRVGSFNRSIQVRPRTQNPLTTYLKNYEDTTVEAFYYIPESDSAGWSEIYGRPFVDVTNEHPIIVEDTKIKVRQEPILMIQEPSTKPSNADPVRPVFTVSIRETIGSSWVPVNQGDIEDYNVSEGTITLKGALPSSDPNLVKVDYTSARRVFNFKYFDTNRLNLNPYLISDENMYGKPIYIYVIPQYVKDQNGVIINSSVQTSTVRFTLNADIFNELRPEYDPLAIQLAVAYIVPTLDIENLIMVDSRSRGGGAYSEELIDGIQHETKDVEGFWDIGKAVGTSYQKGGFVLIRLPKELRTQFPNKQDVIDAVTRNISAGVGFKLETLEGGDW